MYLSDNDIRKILPSLNIETTNENFQFDPQSQIQPCSIDLRIDNIFWKNNSKSTIDLRKSSLLKLSPRKLWKTITLTQFKSIVLRKGDFVLARVYEVFSIPPGYAGKISGRSSYGRMGLSIHNNCDFINPGWRGHMPLQLVNHGNSPIKIFPYLPICQMQLINLTSPSKRIYGEEELQSRFMYDDGSPSYWWLGKKIQSVQNSFFEFDITKKAQDKLLKKFGDLSPDILDRFDKFLCKKRVGEIHNLDDLLKEFIDNENKQYSNRVLLKKALIGSFPLLLSVSLGILFDQPIGWLHLIIWFFTIISILVSYNGFKMQLGEFLLKIKQ